jgi:hypothetical protein
MDGCHHPRKPLLQRQLIAMPYYQTPLRIQMDEDGFNGIAAIGWDAEYPNLMLYRFNAGNPLQGIMVL